ncbi:antimicrobial peptide ABC system ATP-binding protein SapF [Salmonella enterica subsp. enterica]|nr:antimicrobial peptide ABC system ATP-binding protein SapF [Salmonella enterica subsp. enterica]
MVETLLEVRNLSKTFRYRTGMVFVARPSTP